MKQIRSRIRRGKAYPGTQAVIRALTLLKLFTDAQPEWALKDLVKRTKLNKSTLFRLLTALESEGLISRDPISETYRLGPEIIALGGRALRSNPLQIIGRDELKSLAEKTRETASLEVLSGKDVVILEEVVGDRVLSGIASIGTRWPAFATSTGLAILSRLPDPDVQEILKSPLTQFTPKTITSPEQLRRELFNIKQRGFAVADEVLELGYVAIGAAIVNHDGEVAGAISIGGPKVRLTTDRVNEYGGIVRAAALRISSRLGHRLTKESTPA
ncbi:MAG TPA: IclR family transcriptional regulator [Acidobacteriota bacterium]|nr:IclR family transcriptional regulator [Acidobacteriota bacterium]